MAHLGKYVHAPAGSILTRTDMIKVAVEYIGTTQNGCGSDYAKGKRYLRKKICGCSGRAIKKTTTVGIKVHNNDYNTYGLEVYFYHEEMSSKILKEVIRFLTQNENEVLLANLMNKAAKDSTLMEVLYGQRKRGLNWVIARDYMKQGEKAENIKEQIELILS